MIVDQQKMSQVVSVTERTMSRDLTEHYRKELGLVLQLKQAEIERSKCQLIKETEEMRKTLAQADINERKQRQHLQSRELNLLRESQVNADSRRKEEKQQNLLDVQDVKKSIARNDELELLAEQEARVKRQNELESLTRHLNESKIHKNKICEEQKAKEIEYRKGEEDFLRKLEKEGKATTEKVQKALQKSAMFGSIYQQVYQTENEKKKQLEFLMVEKPYQDRIAQQKEKKLQESALRKEKLEKINNALRVQIEDNKLRKDSELLSNLQAENEQLHKEMVKFEAQDAENRLTSKLAMKEYLDSIQSQISEQRANRKTGEVMNVHESGVNRPIIEKTDPKPSSTENTVAFPGFQIQHDRVKQLHMIDRSLRLDATFLQSTDFGNENNRFPRYSFSRRSLAAKLNALEPKYPGNNKENGPCQTSNFKSDYEFIRHKDKGKNYDIISHMFRNS